MMDQVSFTPQADRLEGADLRSRAILSGALTLDADQAALERAAEGVAMLVASPASP